MDRAYIRAIDRCVIAAASLLSLGVCWNVCIMNPDEGAKVMLLDDRSANAPGEELISQWLEAIRRPNPGDYGGLRDFRELPDGARVEQNSRFWSQKFFTDAANPYLQKPAAPCSTHPATTDTFDVLRHEYDIFGQHLIVDETVNVILVTVEQPLESFLNQPEQQKHHEINRIAGLLLRMRGTMVAPNLQDAPYRWTFRFPTTIGNGMRFSTNAQEDPARMWSWASRMDGGIYNDRLYFLCFKQRESTSGKILVPDGRHWFDGKCWAAFSPA